MKSATTGKNSDSGHRSKNGKVSKKRRWKKGIIILGVILAIFAILFLYHYPVAKAVYNNAISGKDDFIKAQGAIGAQDFKGAQKALGTANEKFLKAKESIRMLG